MKKLSEKPTKAAVNESDDSELFRLKAALESTGDAVIVTDIEGRVEFLNPAAERLVGIDRGSAEGRLLHDLFCLHERLGSVVNNDLVQLAIVSGAPVGLGPDLVLVPYGGGAPKEIEGEISVRRSSASIDGTVLTFRDVSVRNQEELKRREQQKVRAVGEFAGSVAHTLNNLLTVILSHSEALHNQFCTVQPVRSSTAEITRAGTEIQTLAHDLLALGGGFKLHPALVDLNGIISGLAPRLKALLADTPVIMSLAADLGTVLIDRDQIERVILHMVQFARNRTLAEGAIELTTANITVDENCRGRYLKKFVQLIVRDSGPNLDSLAIDSLFSPAKDADQEHLSSAINLLAIRTAVTIARGHLGIEPSSEGGAKLVLSLPRYEEEPAPYAACAPPPAHAAAAVLLVEDDNAVRILLRNNLEKHGFSVIEARDGAEAIEQATWYEHPIELLITDVIMPRMDGPTLARTLTETRPDLKVLLISGGADKIADIGDLIQNGARFLTKPFSHSDLLDCIQSMLHPTA